MGNADPRSFSRGKRGVAGTLVFVVFNRDALLAGLKEHIQKNKVFHRVGGTINTEALSIEDWDAKMMNQIGSKTDAKEKTNAVAVQCDPVIADEIPPFDITVSMANEYGSAAVLVLYGCEILNEGMQFSADVIQTQKACTFVARRVKALEATMVAGEVVAS